MKDLFWGFTFLISQAVSPACRLLSLCCCLHASSVFAPARSLSVWTQQSLHPAKCCLTENTQKNIKTIFVLLYTWQSRPQLPLFSHKLKILILVILFLVELQCFYLKYISTSVQFWGACTLLNYFHFMLHNTSTLHYTTIFSTIRGKCLTFFSTYLTAIVIRYFSNF